MHRPGEREWGLGLGSSPREFVKMKMLRGAFQCYVGCKKKNNWAKIFEAVISPL